VIEIHIEYGGVIGLRSRAHFITADRACEVDSSSNARRDDEQYSEYFEEEQRRRRRRSDEQATGAVMKCVLTHNHILDRAWVEAREAPMHRRRLLLSKAG
jgi:hypothetical protein